MVSHGTGPPCPGLQFGTLLSLVILQSQAWAGPAGSCCAHPTRSLQTGKRFLPRLLLTQIKAHAGGQDSLCCTGAGIPRQPHHQHQTRASSSQSLTTHTYTHPQTTPTTATTLSRNTSSPDMAPACCKAPLCICRLPRADGIPLSVPGTAQLRAQTGSLMNSHITLPLEQRFNHPSLTSGTKDLILQHLPQPACSDSGERCFESSWAPGRNKISSVSEYLLNTFIFCWRTQPVVHVLAESICTRNLLQDVDKMEAPSLTCRVQRSEGGCWGLT